MARKLTNRSSTSRGTMPVGKREGEGAVRRGFQPQSKSTANAKLGGQPRTKAPATVGGGKSTANGNRRGVAGGLDRGTPNGRGNLGQSFDSAKTTVKKRKKK
jgi:hypothetical protein